MMFFRHLLLGAGSALVLLAAPALAQNGQKPPKLVAPKIDPDKIYDAVAEPAIPAVGFEAYSQFIDDHLNFPTSALQRRVQGTDSVQFVIEKNGTTSNFVLLKGFDAECDAEALRVMKMAPKWKPARHRGEVVRQRVTVPVTFALPDLPTGGGRFKSDSALLPTSNPAAVQIQAPSPHTNDPITVHRDASVPVPAPSAGTFANETTLPNGLKVVAPATKATPPGGTDAFFVWIKQNIQYPAAARRAKAEGKLQVEFIIEPDGSLTNVKVLNHLPFGLEAEAIRLIKSAPKWTPAQYDGRSIKQKMVLPVIFQL